MTDLLMVSSSPHIRSEENIQIIMRDVVIALLPAAIFGIINFGVRALLIMMLTIITCVISEYAYQRMTKRKVTITDGSAVVTGLLLGMNLPHNVPIWIPIIGGVFAMIIIKQLFGGLGQNFMNPALGARAFLLISYANIMTNWQLDGITTATPLTLLKGTEAAGKMPGLLKLFIGSVGGSVGETSALLLLIGGLYLLLRKVISWRIPVTYLLTVFVMALLFGGKGFDVEFAAYHLVSGGLILGAFFMATDYASSPVTPVGQLIMGAGCGLFTMIFRLYGLMPEGVSFAILIMNLFVPLIDRLTIPRAFGEVAKK